jgi:hypothetical protein
MSGGHFNHSDYTIQIIADEIEEAIRDVHKEPKDDYSRNYSEKTISEFEKAVKLLKEAHVYVRRIDWLLSGDDDEDTFHERLREDLESIKDEDGKI